MDRQWSTTFEFVLYCLIPSIGLSTFWRFPVVAYENGGGAFWYAYLVVLATIGLPLYFLELSIGQFSHKSNIYLYSKFGIGYSGIAVAQTYLAVCVSTYYAALLSYILMYFYYSFEGVLPWGVCEEEWGKFCVPVGHVLPSNPDNNYTSSADLFFTKVIIRQQYLKNFSAPQWQLCICLFVSLGLVNMYLSSNSPKLGKYSYFLVMCPFVCAVIMIGLAVSLVGGFSGVAYFFKPDFSLLREVEIWYHAVAQCFFSLGIGFGTVSLCASRSPFRANVKRITVIVALLDCVACCLIGTIEFGVLGHLSYALKADMGSVIDSDRSGLAFIVYSIALTKISHGMSVTFFGMLYILSLLCLISFQQIAVSLISYWFPSLFWWQIATGCSVTCFFISLTYISPNGVVLIHLLNNYCVTSLITIISICEIWVLMYGYGFQSICLDIRYMLTKKVNIYWRIMWSIVIPTVLTTIYLAYLQTIRTYTHKLFEHSTNKIVFVWFIITIGALQIPGWAVYYLYRNRHLGYPRVRKETFDSSGFAPDDPDIKESWEIFKEEELQKFLERNDGCCLRFLKSVIDK